MIDWEAEIKDVQQQLLIARQNVQRLEGALAQTTILQGKEAAAEAAVAEAEQVVEKKSKKQA